MNESPSWLPDWIRISCDNRISYWSGGARGKGARRQPRRRTREEAYAFARDLIAQHQQAEGLAIEIGVTWAELCQAWVDAHDGEINEGTMNRRASAINAWILPHAGNVQCADSSLRTLVRVADAVAAQRGASTFDSTVETMQVVARWGRERGYLPAEPLGSDAERQGALRPLRRRAQARTAAQRKARNDADGTDRDVTIDQVPTWHDVCVLADAVTDHTGGITRSRELGERYGAAVRVTAGTGVRLCELLGLDPSEVDKKNGVLVLRHQLNRYVRWDGTSEMPTAPLKHCQWGDSRVVPVWAKVRDDLELLLEDGGPLVPPTRGVKWWADAWGRYLERARRETGWRWKPHWLRHHYGSVSYTPREHGGMGMPAITVQQALGHKKLSTFLDCYAHPTSSPPGWVE